MRQTVAPQRGARIIEATNVVNRLMRNLLIDSSAAQSSDTQAQVAQRNLHIAQILQMRPTNIVEYCNHSSRQIMKLYSQEHNNYMTMSVYDYVHQLI